MSDEYPGSTHFRPTPDPKLLFCPACTAPVYGVGVDHQCPKCETSFRPASHTTMGVRPDDLDRLRLFHEASRFEAALKHYGFPPPTGPIQCESAFDRIIDGLAAAEAAGNELEEERDLARAQLAETRRALDRAVGRLTELRGHKELSKLVMRGVVAAVLQPEYDEDEDRHWTYCLVCDDEATDGERLHSYEAGPETCVVYDLQQTLAKLEGKS